MAYTSLNWQSRIRERSDFSTFLSHLTRDTSQNSAIEVLVKILKDKKIIGSSLEGYIAGGTTATCFQDAPIYSLCQNIFHEQKNRQEFGGKVRYRPIGLAFPKMYAYSKGTRPVIYEQLDVAKNFIDKSQWWRIVSLDLSDCNKIIDWTHEREWRKSGDFEFELQYAYVLLTNKKAYQIFLKNADTNILESIAGIVVLDPILS